MSINPKFKSSYENSPCPAVYNKQVKRFIETQEIAATTNLVDDLEEQFLLEQMLDAVKPPYREDTEHMHYLLKTPFRYPPLKYGSRFGTRTVPSFFYAGEDTNATLGEVAYYRFVFLSHMQQPYDDAIRSQHMMFSLQVETIECADLTLNDFSPFETELTNKHAYEFCQNAGKWLVEEQQIEVIRYHSARVKGAINIAISQPSAIVSNEPEQCQNWLCLTLPDKVSFTHIGGGQPITFNREEFLVEGQLPTPA